MTTPGTSHGGSRSSAEVVLESVPDTVPSVDALTVVETGGSTLFVDSRDVETVDVPSDAELPAPNVFNPQAASIKITLIIRTNIALSKAGL
jgi:hypothetical protein